MCCCIMQPRRTLEQSHRRGRSLPRVPPGHRNIHETLRAWRMRMAPTWCG
jgi:hypothetical protein